MTVPQVDGLPLVGRDTELTALRAGLVKARSGRVQSVTLEGEPGTGKSSLLRAFVADADHDLVRWVRCDEFERTVGFAVVGRLLDEPDLKHQSTVEVGRRLLRWFGDQQETCAGAVVLAVDDAQWMDRASTQALRFAVRRLRADRVLCLVARRLQPDGLMALETDDPEAVVTQRLGLLDGAAVEELALLIWSTPIPPSVASDVVTRTGGLPLLVSAVLRGVEGAEQLHALANVPTSVTDVVRRQLAAVAEPARDLVEASAVLGHATPLAVVAQLAGSPGAAPGLTDALAAGLLVTTRQGDVDCAHDVVRDAVMDLLPPDRRRALHERAARLTAGDRQLVHRAEALHRPDPELAEALVRAADEAHTAGWFGHAASHRLRARAAADDASRRDELLRQALVELLRNEDLPAARTVAPLVQQAPASAPRELALGLFAGEEGRIGPARVLLRSAVDRAYEEDDDETAAAAVRALAELEVRLGNGLGALALLGDAEEIEDDNAARLTLVVRVPALWQAGDLAAATELLSAALSVSRGQRWESELLVSRGLVDLVSGRVRESLESLDTAIRLSHQWQATTDQSYAYQLRSTAKYHVGDWDGAAVDATAARTLSEGTHARWAFAAACGASIVVPANRGQWDQAAGYLTQGRAAWPAAGHLSDVSQFAVVLAAARGDQAGVLAELDPLWNDAFLLPMERTRLSPPLYQAHIAACIAVGRLVDAESDLVRYESVLSRWPGGMVPDRLGWLRGLLAEATRDPGAAREHYATDLADPAMEEYPFLLAQLLLTSGRLERALGDRPTALQRLTRARDLFAGLRALPFLERCTSELEACGRSTRVASPLALTPREEDVVALVTRGYTNKEVAAELFLTTKTVEFHVRNIFTKLGVRSRGELRRLRHQSVIQS